MNINKVFLAVSLLIPLSFSSVVSAAPLSVSFTGNVEYYNDTSGLLNDLLGLNGINIGDAFSAGYTIESTTPGSGGPVPWLPSNYSEYVVEDSSHSINVDIAGTVVNGIGLGLGSNPDHTLVAVGNDDVGYPKPTQTQDVWYMAEVSAYDSVINPDYLLDIVVGFATTDINYLNNSDYFLSGGMAGWEFGFFEINSLNIHTDEYTRLVYGTSSAQTAVPEPSALALLCIGLVGAGLARRGRRT